MNCIVILWKNTINIIADAESVKNDLLQIPDVGQEIVDQVFANNFCGFLHLVEDTEDKGGIQQIDDIKELPGGQKAIRALELINKLNALTCRYKCRDDTGMKRFNYCNEEEGIFNGINECIGIHHLGLFKNNNLMTLMKNQGAEPCYGMV